MKGHPVKTLLAAVSVASLSLFNTAHAAGEHDMNHGAAMNQGAQMHAAGAQAMLSEGTVKKVDKAGGKITISHGPLENLGMPPMTMAFRAGDPAMLDKVKPGDRIRFLADRVDGMFVVTRLDAAK